MKPERLDPAPKLRLEGRQLYLAWIDYQRRAESMRQVLGFQICYLPSPVASRRLKVFGYLAQARGTWRALRAARPDVVWVQAPPNFLPHLLILVRPFAGRFRIVLDGHNGALTPPWSRFPGTVWAANRCDRVLVHNAEMRPVAEALGVRPELIAVLEDPPPRLAPAASEPDGGAPYVLVPCSFNPDEHAPIPAVLAAARLMPEVPFKITGRRRKAEALGLIAAAPANVEFTDYLPLDAFEALLAGAGVVLGVTSRVGCQLSVANEALGAHRPLVLSDTAILREMFGTAALFAANAPAPLAAALAEALARREELGARSAALKARRQRAWVAEAAHATRPLG